MARTKSRYLMMNVEDITEKPSGAATPEGSSLSPHYFEKSLGVNNNMDLQIKQDSEASDKQDAMKGRHFAYVVYPESAPADWIEQLQQTGLSFVVSPLHDKDIDPTGTPKKPHYHVIISWGNTTTYRAARGLCDKLRCPRPQALKSPNAMYRYLTHKDNPDKYQYEEQPVTYNGWVRPLNAADVVQLKREIWGMVYTNDCQEYGELLMVCVEHGSEYFDVASSHTIFFSKICDGYRHSPIRTLKRRYNMLDDGPEKEQVYEVLLKYTGVDNEEQERTDTRTIID